VGAALQGYLRGLPALAISTEVVDSLYLDTAAKLAALLVSKINSNVLSTRVFLNVNLPNLPLAEIRGVEITQLATESHTDTVDEGYDGKRKYYWLVRQKINKDADKRTDLRAIEEGNISITPLHFNLTNHSSPPIPDSLCSDLLQELKSGVSSSN
jgi:5'-nucleotidase